MYNIHIETLGCRLNQIESEAVSNLFSKEKYNVIMSGVSASVQEDDNTVLCILNTCTVTQKAEQKARRIIRLLLKKFPRSVIVVTGCYAQLAYKEINAIDSRIAVVKGQIKSRLAGLPDLLNHTLEENLKADDVAKIIKEKISNPIQEKIDFPEQSFKLSTSSFVAHSRASLKIQDGCNSNCSYCAIHMARGKSVSIDVETALERVLELEKSGQNEIVLTTVNIGQYKGKYKDTYVNFTGLLKILLENTKSVNFRISSLYPEVVNEEFCEVIKSPRVRPHFHLSVQSGSNKILKAMNRKYEAQQVIDACNMLKKAKENPFLACDIITGFPDESDEDFNMTMDLCKKCDFSWIHAFPYSERPGTVAAMMKNKVPQNVSGSRASELTKWAINQKIKYINSFKGKKVTAIIESTRKPLGITKDALYIYHAMTENFIHCEIKSNKLLEASKQILVEIEMPLEDRIIKGGEIEASAKIF